MLELLEVTTPSLAYVCLGGFVVVFSMISFIVKEKFYINEVVLGTAFGIAMGPHGANAFDPRSWGSETEVTLEVMRVVLATGLFAIGVEIPRSYMRDHVKGLSVMVVPTMAIGWGIVSGILFGLFPRLGIFGCLAIAACLTPTDPIICAAIVGGKFAVKHVPLNLRQILSAESAANDGLAYPFLSISIYLLIDATSREAVGHWFLVGWLYQVICGTVLGALIGIAFRHLMRVSHRKGYIDRESYVSQYLALAFLTIGIASTLGLDDLLAAFAAGNAISWDGDFNDRVEGDTFSSVLDLVLNCGAFIYIGAWLPFTSFNDTSLGLDVWRLVVLFLAILVLRRIPSIMFLYHWVDEINGWKEALFTGHFGPMGVGAIFVSTLALTRLPEPQDPPQSNQEYVAAVMHPIVSFVVLGSIITHGLSIPFFTMGRNFSRTLSIPVSSTFRSINGTPDWMNLTKAPKTNSGTATPLPQNGPSATAAKATDQTQNQNQNQRVVDVEIDVEAGLSGDYERAHVIDEETRPKEKRVSGTSSNTGSDCEKNQVNGSSTPVKNAAPGSQDLSTIVTEKKAVQFQDVDTGAE
ncbi:hypothetical protein K435DRAFT_115986 [Dendrothele bispora CBS 962.96]|uniref:Cation/H+ exchanger transmembrane domain-containing protein n=1 Tax=Dendrothele bispora (strain CBS 962.96) TaxID=1314807 RepID=A0A4V4HI45_DENBC|nr:hypothetical protein K435DRAFT_115986 [Dendrothele bispora CBS 962.96]